MSRAIEALSSDSGLDKKRPMARQGRIKQRTERLAGGGNCCLDSQTARKGDPIDWGIIEIEHPLSICPDGGDPNVTHLGVEDCVSPI